jgi:hypothetical protein
VGFEELIWYPIDRAGFSCSNIDGFVKGRKTPFRSWFDTPFDQSFDPELTTEGLRTGFDRLRTGSTTN